MASRLTGESCPMDFRLSEALKIHLHKKEIYDIMTRCLSHLHNGENAMEKAHWLLSEGGLINV